MLFLIDLFLLLICIHQLSLLL